MKNLKKIMKNLKEKTKRQIKGQLLKQHPSWNRIPNQTWEEAWNQLTSQFREDSKTEKITREELTKILSSHCDWLNYQNNGEMACFTGKDLEAMDLNQRDLRKISFMGAYLPYSSLRGTDLREANFANANLLGADLTDANLKGCNFEGANLRYANLKGANLLYANFKEANLNQTKKDHKG